MPLPPLANIEDLSERLALVLLDEYADPTSPDGVRALAALDDASALIRAEAGEDWVDEYDELAAVPAIIEAICLAVAYRAYQNPSGATQTSVGDVSVSFSRQGVAGAIFLTRAEQRAVRKAGGRSGIGSIVLESAHPVGNRNALYAPVQGGGDMIPLGPVPWEGG